MRPLAQHGGIDGDFYGGDHGCKYGGNYGVSDSDDDVRVVVVAAAAPPRPARVQMLRRGWLKLVAFGAAQVHTYRRPQAGCLYTSVPALKLVPPGGSST